MSRIITLPNNNEIKEGGEPQNSPHVLSLKTPKKTQTKRCVDIIDPNPKKTRPKAIPKKSRPARKTELLRMGAIAVTIVFLLNIAQMYPKTKQAANATLDAAYAGVESLLEVTPTDISKTTQAFEVAFEKFETAQEMIWYLTDQPSEVMNSNKHLKTATNLLETGEAVSSAGQLFALFAGDIETALANIFQESSEGKPSITEELSSAFQAYIPEAQGELKKAQDHLSEIETKVLPDEYQEQVVLVTEQIAALNTFLEEISANFPLILELLGNEYPQKYMILLENNSELRPGGGFIGSFLIVDLNDGYIDNIEFHDVYEYDGAFNEYIEPPVSEIEYLTCCWGLRDANYSPDYAVSSEAVAWFFEKEGGPTVDHVLMVDLDFVTDLLDVVGPIEIEGLEGELTGENFELVMSYVVESKLEGVDAPKSILGDVIPVIKEKITEPQNLLGVVGTLLSAMQSKHVAAYSLDEDLQAFWEGINVDGQLYMPGENEDYLLVTTSGIGGNKTDRYTYQDIEHKTLISSDGTLLNQLTIIREHVWDEDVEMWQMETLGDFGFETISEEVRSILGAGDNVSGIRVYVPYGAQLLSVEGELEKEIETFYDEDLELDYFYAIVRTPAGEESQIEITYSLPFTLEIDPVDDYFLYVETQPGAINTTFTKEIIAPNLTSHAFYPKNEFTETADLTYTYTTNLNRPLHLGGVFSN